MLNQRAQTLAHLEQHNGALGTVLLKKFQSLDPVFELVAQGLAHHYATHCVDPSACVGIAFKSNNMFGTCFCSHGAQAACWVFKSQQATEPSQ